MRILARHALDRVRQHVMEDGVTLGVLVFLEEFFRRLASLLPFRDAVLCLQPAGQATGLANLVIVHRRLQPLPQQVGGQLAGGGQPVLHALATGGQHARLSPHAQCVIEHRAHALLGPARDQPLAAEFEPVKGCVIEGLIAHPIAPRGEMAKHALADVLGHEAVRHLVQEGANLFATRAGDTLSQVEIAQIIGQRIILELVQPGEARLALTILHGGMKLTEGGAIVFKPGVSGHAGQAAEGKEHEEDESGKHRRTLIPSDGAMARYLVY